MIATVAVGIAALYLLACGPSVRVVKPTTESERLRNYSQVRFQLITTPGEHLAAVRGEKGAIDRFNQVALAAKRLSSQLRAIGFDLVNDPALAKADAAFRIGSVRHDPITGWIADEASLIFSSVPEGKVIASLVVDARWGKLTIEAIVERLAEAVKENY